MVTMTMPPEMTMPPDPAPLTDPTDERLTQFRALRTNERALRRDGLVIAESPLTVARVLASGHPVERIAVTPSAAELLADRLGPARASGTEVVIVAPRTLDAAVGFHLHRGALALVRPAPPVPVEAILAGARRIVVLEAVNDLENLGVVFRSAAALGLDAVLACPRCADPWSRRAVRVSVGTALDLPWARLAPWPAALDSLRDQGFRLAAFTPSGEVDVDDPRWSRADRLAVLLGAEGPGLSDEVLADADVRVRIPMLREVDSLNVAAAATLAFHAATR